MQPGDWINLASAVIAGGSAATAIVAARRARNAEETAGRFQARSEQQAERAIKAAEQAAIAQRQSSEAARRSADALEQQNRMAEEQVDLAEGVPWRLVHRRGDTYELQNVTDTPKFQVQITGYKVASPPVTAERLDGRSALTFMALPISGDDQISVTWHRRPDSLSDTLLSWSGVKPEKR